MTSSLIAAIPAAPSSADRPPVKAASPSEMPALELMYTRKRDPDIPEQLADAIARTKETFFRLITDAQERGEIVPDDPERIALLAGAALHGVAGFTATGHLPPETALTGVDELVHHLLHGLRPR
ncbi:TetR-like C-terminal domain-containing protein [Streptomyces sp. NPDC052687]|uniref:TetR-like C-terminal domain-containing protein n=1 Tax=Streptomyces sp. NPDC052687 TaxID=3154759 RepID=UPI003413CEA7